MFKINIFIASSIVEFKNEREQFILTMGRLHDYLYENRICNLVIHRCEDFEINILKQNEGTQDRLNEMIKSSDITLFFFGNKIGDVSKQELEIAFDNYKKTNKSLPFVFFIDKEYDNDLPLKYMSELKSKNIDYILIEEFKELIFSSILFINDFYKLNLPLFIFKNKLWIEEEFIMDDILSINKFKDINEDKINKILFKDLDFNINELFIDKMYDVYMKLKEVYYD